MQAIYGEQDEGINKLTHDKTVDEMQIEIEELVLYENIGSQC